MPASAPSFSIADYSETAAVAERKPVNAASYELGKWLGTRAACLGRRCGDANIWRICARRDAIYAREGLGHPGLLQRVMNKVLVDNAILGPWIHVGSRMQLLSAGASGDELTARAKVTGNYEKKGHRFVELDALVVANGTHAAGALPAHRDLPAARAGGGVGADVAPLLSRHAPRKRGSSRTSR